MKNVKRILSILLILVFNLSLLPTYVTAASYPMMFPKEYNYTFTQGETAQIKFTIFHEYQNEKAHVRVHKGDRYGEVVASADRNFYPVDYTSEYTVSWDTKNVEPGEYVVEYWTSFYTFFEWREEPTHDFLLKIKVVAPNNKPINTASPSSTSKQGAIRVSDYNTYINNLPIHMYNIDGEEGYFLRAEDLQYYGFYVNFVPEWGTLYISKNNSIPTGYLTNVYNGSIQKNDYVVRLVGDGFNYVPKFVSGNGYMFIHIDELKCFGINL